MDDAANVIIVAVILLLGLFALATAIIHTTYTPEWRRSSEAEHMEEVFEDFEDLKRGIDIVASASVDRVVTLSQDIRMGGGGIPVISPEKSGGMLKTDPLLPSIYIATDSYTRTIAFEHLGSIAFTSDNRFALDRTYIYENGAVIVSEINRTMMRLPPSITFKRFNNGTKAVTLRIINMSLDNESVASSGIEEISFTYRSSTTRFSDAVTDVSITVTSDHTPAWEEFMLDGVRRAGFNESEYDVSSSESVRLDIHGDVDLTIVEVKVDGRIEPVIETGD